MIIALVNNFVMKLMIKFKVKVDHDGHCRVGSCDAELDNQADHQPDQKLVIQLDDQIENQS